MLIVYGALTNICAVWMQYVTGRHYNPIADAANYAGHADLQLVQPLAA